MNESALSKQENVQETIENVKRYCNKQNQKIKYLEKIVKGTDFKKI